MFGVCVKVWRYASGTSACGFFYTLTDNFSLNHYLTISGLWGTSLVWHGKDIGVTGVDEKESSPKRLNCLPTIQTNGCVAAADICVCVRLVCQRLTCVSVASAAPHESNTLLQVEEQGEYLNLQIIKTSALLKMPWFFTGQWGNGHHMTWNSGGSNMPLWNHQWSKLQDEIFLQVQMSVFTAARSSAGNTNTGI